MTTTIPQACPACMEGQVDVEVDYDWLYITARVKHVWCGCELDPSQRDALERQAIRDIESGEIAA